MNCIQCGKEITPNEGKGRPRKFCDAVCREKWYAENSKVASYDPALEVIADICAKGNSKIKPMVKGYLRQLPQNAIFSAVRTMGYRFDGKRNQYVKGGDV